MEKRLCGLCKKLDVPLNLFKHEDKEYCSSCYTAFNRPKCSICGKIKSQVGITEFMCFERDVFKTHDQVLTFEKGIKYV